VSGDISPGSRITHPIFNIGISVIALNPISTAMRFLDSLDEKDARQFVTFDNDNAGER